MNEEVKTLTALMRKAFLLWQAAKWNRTARKLMHTGYSYEIERAMNMAATITSMI